MKLALNLHNVLPAIQYREEGRLLEKPHAMLRDLRFWKTKGYEGVLLYDVGILRHAAKLKPVFDEAGMHVACVNLLRRNLFLPQYRDRDERCMYQALEACEVLEPDIVDIIMAVPFPSQRGPTMIERIWYRGDYAPFEDFAAAAVRLKRFAQSVASIGADVSIELHDDGLHDTADNCIRLMHMIDEPNVGLNPDIGNFHRVPYSYSESWRSQVIKMAPYTNYFEIKNYRRIWHSATEQYIWWAVDVDLGDMDFRDATKILWDAGFRGWVANEGGNGDFLGQGTRGDKFASELQFARWFRHVREEWLPLVTKALGTNKIGNQYITFGA